MAKVDAFIHASERFGAQALILTSDEKVTLKLATGSRFANQSTPHVALMAMIREVVPRGAALKTPGNTSFVYELGGKGYQFEVEATEHSWTVDISPAKPAPRTSVAPGRSKSRARMSARPAVPRRSEAPPPVRASQPPSARVRPRSDAPASTSKVTAGRGRASLRPEVLRAPTVRVAESSARQIDALLHEMVKMGASDLHLSVGSPPSVRQHGSITALQRRPPLEAAGLERMIAEITPAKNRAEFEERSDSDFAYSIEGLSRFRVNVFRDRKGPGAVLRAIPFTILTPEQIGLPPKVLELCSLTKGLVVVTGPTGSGKSTTLATLIDHVNDMRSDHIITIEDPVEFVHENKKCLVNQREIHTHTRSFKDALRAALREDPDIVLVGEMRDLETIAIAVETAETGHLVFGTLHTTTAPSTVDRIVDQFPADRQEQIRQMLSESLKGVVAQTLCKKKGGGRVAAYEILLGTTAVSNLIRERKTFQLFSVMQTGRALGMQTLNDSLLDLVRKGLVEPREAYVKAVNKSELKGILEREGFKDFGG